MKISTKIVFDIGTGERIEEQHYDYTGPLALCDRAAQARAKQAANTAATTASGYGSTAAGEGGTLRTALTNDVNNPTGFSPQELNNMLVQSQQGAGGATAGVTGAAGLNAMRTKNSSATSALLDAAARSKAQALSGNALGIQNRSALLAQQKRESALRGLQGMYGSDVGAQMRAMGLVPEDINAEMNAGRSGWLQNVEGGLDTLGGLASKAAGIVGGYAG